MKFKIGNKIISNNSKTYFIADIGANHEGSLSKAKKLIKLAADSGADAAKFQHFSADTIISSNGFDKIKKIQSHQSKWKKSVYDIYKKYSLNIEWTKELINECKKNSITFFTSPYSLEYVDYFDKYIPAYKIGSGDITWIEILEKISKKNKPVLMATGASEMKEVDDAVKKITKHNKKLILMQCNTNYTASENNFRYINLNVLKIFKKKYPNLILGLSDHTFGHETVLGAIAMGARVIEKHFTDNNSQSGPDHKFAMNPKTWEKMVNSARKLELALGDGIKKVEKNEKSTHIVQRRSLVMARKLTKGDTIKRKDLKVLRPCPMGAFAANQIKHVIGKKINKSKNIGDHLLKKDV